MDTKYSQIDFSGGLNVNSRIGPTELQECVNCNLDDMGSIRPDYADTLLKTVSNVSCLQVIDDWIYYLVDTSLFRVDTNGFNNRNIGTIGAGNFFAYKNNEVHIIVASDKCYKIVEGTITSLGVEAPTNAPLLSKSTQLSKSIESFETLTDFEIATGAHKVGFGNSAFYVDGAGRNMTTLGVAVGQTLVNITDGSMGLITAIGNQDATNDKISVVLAGGTDNDFDTSDSIQITHGSLLAITTKHKGGTYALKITVPTTNQEAIAIKTFSPVQDLTVFADVDATVSQDEDIISFWLYVNDYRKYTSVTMYFDVEDGTFENEFYKKTIPVMPSNVDLGLNEDWGNSFVDEKSSLYWDTIFGAWRDRNNEDVQDNSTGIFGSGTLRWDKELINRNQAQNTPDNVKKKTDKKKVISDNDAWSKIKLRKSDFIRHGNTEANGWDTVKAVKFSVYGQEGLYVIVDGLNLVGGGVFEGDKYAVSYSYVYKHTFADGTIYEEESALSPEDKIRNCERQNIVVSDIEDSDDIQVTHKRIYIRGGGLELRHKVADVATGTTTYTISTVESTLVARTVEDCRLNLTPPTNVIDGVFFDGRLFLLKNKTVYFSRSLQPSAFQPNDYIDLPSVGMTIFEKGSNLAIVTKSKELLYVNPGSGVSAGGYIHYAETPQGCEATRSAAEGFYLGKEGIIYFAGNEPEIVSQKIRSELLALSGRTDGIGAFVRGRYYLCIPSEEIMYEMTIAGGSYVKYDGIQSIAGGDDGQLYLLKSDGIYSFSTDLMTLKAFSFRTPEFILPDNSEFRQIIVDADFPISSTVEYYLNNTVKNSKTENTIGRRRITFPITQEAQNRISIRVSTTSISTDIGLAVYGVYLQ